MNSLFIIPIIFGIIHLVEYASYLSRIAGIKYNLKVLSYSVQQMFFVGTRFFFLALMPLIGYQIDSGISKDSYIYILYLSMLCASLSYILVIILKNSIINLNKKIFIKKTQNKIRLNLNYKEFSFKGLLKYKKIYILSSIVFSGYSLGVFVAFYFALIYSDYSTTISQMSGIVNGFSTVLLTFILEPILAKNMDEDNEDVVNMIAALLFGRLLGVLILSPILILFLSFF